MEISDNNLDKIILQSWCDSCGIDGYIAIDDVGCDYAVKCAKCGQLCGSQVFCDKCGVGGSFVENIETKPASWFCSQCETVYALNNAIYDNPVELVPEPLPDFEPPKKPPKLSEDKSVYLLSSFSEKKILIYILLLAIAIAFVSNKHIPEEKNPPDEVVSEFGRENGEGDFNNTSKKITPSELIERSLEIARLSAELKTLRNTNSDRARTKFITNNQPELSAVYQNYMDRWQRKIEQIGRLNYPDAARNLTKDTVVIATVSINKDGSVDSIEIKRDTKNNGLYDGLMKIIRLASPFEPFSEEIKQEVDVLHITRAFYFRSASGDIDSEQ